MDKDPVGADFIGMSNPLSFCNLTADEQLNHWPLELYDKNYKMAGTVNISTQFIWYDSDPIPKKLNSKCQLVLTILDGEWFSDADTFGQQDPYIQWTYGKDIMKTTVKDDAGKKAEWNETFTL